MLGGYFVLNRVLRFGSVSQSGHELKIVDLDLPTLLPCFEWWPRRNARAG